MARISDADTSQSEKYIQQVLAGQAEKWGAPLLPYLIYAHRPSIFRGVRAMWQGIGASALISESLQALVNRRVAAINGCEF
jgi:hypothetical protein